MLKRKLFWWTEKSDSEWLSFRLNKWAAQCQGYTKLHSSRISRGCQTMMDRPEQPEVVWTRTSKEVTVDLPQSIKQINKADEWKEELRCPAVSKSLVKNVFSKQEIIDYINYLNRPVINMNDNYIEIHQYHFSPEMIQPVSECEEMIRPPTRRKHRIKKSSTDIVNTTALESKFSEGYSKFLVKKSDQINRNIEIVPDRKIREMSPVRNDNDLDVHRELKQSVEVCIEEARIKRGHTFSVGSLRKPEDSLRVQNDPKHFLSFRMSKKNKSGRRKKKVVVGEKGLDGPIWPGVLLTFDRAVSPVQSQSGCGDETDI